MPGYTIEKLLGRGGMGAVYRGVQMNLDRPVAIKILPPGVEKEDPSFAERFKSEARLMAKLMHPAIVAVFDFGSTTDGQLYFAMEYVDGSDVSQMIREQGRLQPDHALAITAHVCDALTAAHKLGIVHRDIKPANVLLNHEGQVKIADFGLAKIDDPSQHGMTKTGYAMGTPDFVSPEALMLGTAIDGRADIYAVGVMLYQMLTGNIPRGAYKTASALRPTLDPRYDPIISKAMQYDREERYQSAAEMRRDLDVILTVPFVQQDVPAAAAVPVSQVAQMPAQRSAAQKPMGKAPQPKSTTGTPARQEAAAAGRSAHGTSQAPKSNTTLYAILGIAAVLAIGAFVMFSGGKKPAPATAAKPSVADKTPTTSRPPVQVAKEVKPVPAVIPQGALEFQGSKYQLVIKADQPAWQKCKAEAEAMGGHLAVINSEAENEWILRTFGSALTTGSAQLWLGAMRGGKDAEWEWVTGDPFEKTFWMSDKPNAGKDQESQWMSLLRRHSGELGWNSVVAGDYRGNDRPNLKGFIVEWDGAKSTIPAASTTAPPTDGWQPLFEEVYWQKNEPGKREFKDGRKHLLGMSMSKALPSADGAIRVRIHFQEGSRSMALAARRISTEEEYKVNVSNGTTETLGSVGAGGKTLDTLGKHDLPKPLRPGDSLLLELQAQGDRLTVSLDGAVVIQARDSRYAGPGQWGILADDGYFESVEVRTGFAKSAVPASPSLPISKPSEPESSPAQRALFDGNTFSGWHGLGQTSAPATWRIAESAMVGSGRAVLVTDEAFDDFDFSLEWRVGPQGNGGIVFLLPETESGGQFDTTRPEFNLMDDSMDAENRSGSLFGVQETTSTTAVKPVGSWNSARLVKRGGKVEHWLNEQLVCSYDLNDPATRERWKGTKLGRNAGYASGSGGRIGLQGWTGEVAYRKVMLRSPAANAAVPSSSSSTSVPPSASRQLPPELAALDDQFVALQKERVIAPFAAEVAKLKAGYLGGMDRAIASERAAGRLDGILALEVEKKLLTAGQPVPESDDAKTPDSLKALGSIYRSAHAKFTATRAANLQALTDPLEKRLAQMETDFTKADRLGDAETVRSYRDALAESGRADGPPSAVAASQTALGGPSAPPPSTTLNPAAMLALKDGITNTLGMKFLPVKGTEVLFCIHEVRYKDYAAYAAESQGVDGGWKNQTIDGYAITERNEDHPVISVRWEDAQKFCAWLSKKEGKLYRLPTDEEWSYAVGIGRDEKRKKGMTPSQVPQVPDEFPWGGDFPPKTKDQAGNYSDDSRKAKAPRAGVQYIENYDDGHPTTAPVMSYQPNKLGLYDLGGNVWEWCEDWYDNAQKERVLRGGSWGNHERGPLLSSNRSHVTPTGRSLSGGFRLVLVVSSSAP